MLPRARVKLLEKLKFYLKPRIEAYLYVMLYGNLNIESCFPKRRSGRMRITELPNALWENANSSVCNLEHRCKAYR